MGIKKKVSILGVIALSIFGLILFQKSSPIKASNDEYSLEAVADKQEGQLILKMKIATPKNETLRLEYSGIDGIGSETLLEGLPDSQSDLIVPGKESLKSRYIEFKTKKGKSITNDIPLSMIQSTEPEKGKATLYSGDTIVAEVAFDLPVIEKPTLVEKPKEKESTETNQLTPRAMAVTPRAGEVTVTDWAGLVAEITTGSADKIVLGNNIDASSAGPTITRSVTISGGPNKNTLNMLTRNFTLGRVATATTLSFEDITLNSSGSLSAILDATTANSANWQLNFSNLTLPEGNYKGLVSAVNSKVSFTGTNDLNIIGARTMIAANGLSVDGDLSFKAATVAGAVQNADFFVNSQINPVISVANSKFVMNTNGSIFNSSGGASSTTTANFSNSEISSLFATTTNFLLETGTVNLTMDNAPVTAAGFSTNFIRGTAGISATITNSPILIDGTVQYLMYANNTLNVTHTNSKVTVKNLTAGGYRNNGAGGTIDFDNSELDVNMSAGNYLFEIAQQAAVTFKNSSTVNFISTNGTNGNFYNAVNAAANSSLTVNDSEVTIDSGAGTAINVGTGDGDGSPNFMLNLSGPTSIMDLTSTSNQTGTTSGVVSIDGKGSEFHITNQAELNVYSNNVNSTPAVMIMAEGGGFYISGQSKIYLESQGNPNNLIGTMRFRIKGFMTFDLDGNSKMEVKKNGGTTTAIRMYGGSNQFLVKGASDLLVSNAGSGAASDNGDTGKQALYFTGTTAGAGANTFDVQGEDSNVSLTALKGPAIEGASYPINIATGKDTYFVARGQTSGATSGIFVGGAVNVNFDTMKYFDFTNTRPNGGAIFTSTSGTFESKVSDLSLWKRAAGVNVAGNPNKSFVMINYILSGANFNVFNSGSPELSSYFATEGGLSGFTRMNGNNQRAVIDELRVPTDADKFIYGHASIPEGKGEDNRDAWVDEVSVKLDVYDAAGTTKLYSGLEGTIVEGSPNSGTISVYGDDERSGIFRIATPDGKFLPADAKIVVTDAWRGDLAAGKAHISEKPGDFIAPDRTVLDVTPPTPTVLTDENLNNATKVLSGTGAEAGAIVNVYYDNGDKDAGTLLGTSTVAADGTWSFDLPQYVDKTKELSVYLEDKAGQHTAAQVVSGAGVTPVLYDQIGLIKPPVTNTVNGNINPYNDLAYHDAVFAGVKKYTVADVIPDSPTMKKSVVSSGGATTSVGDTLTYTLEAANEKAGSNDWADVKLIDVLQEGLDFDPATANVKITKDGVEKAGVLGTDFNYEEATRTLTILVGNLSSVTDKNSVKASFDVKVAQGAVDQEILNKATAVGNSPQESPFVPGPSKPDATYVSIDKVSNVVSVGNVFGVLSFVSAPTALDFGIKTEKLDGKTIAVNPKIVGENLVVSDNRGNLQQWTMSAALITPLANGDAIFPDAIHYVNGTSDEVITGLSKPIFSHKNDKAGEYNITEEEWVKKDNGFKIELAPGAVNKLGKYTATIEFTLADTK